MNVPTSGTGSVNPNLRTIDGEYFFKADLGDIFNLLLQPHNISLNQVQEYLGWFIGSDNSTQEISIDMQIKSIDPNLTRNVELVNQQNIRLRHFNGVLNFILKNHRIRSSYKSLIPKQNIYLYEDEVSGRKIACGIILLKMCFNAVKPQLVFDHHVK